MKFTLTVLLKNIRLRLCIIAILVFAPVFSIFSQTVDEQIESIISQMTTDEKIYQLINNTFFTTGDNTRLGIPGFIMSDGPHGIRFGGATCFPTGIAQAASWDVDLIERVGKAMGDEFWSQGKHQQLGPCLDLCRDPRNGRSPETLGEDPFLAGKIGVAVVKGIQQSPVVATAKHFNLVNKQQYRYNSNATISERMLMEHYGLSFKQVVQTAGVKSIMNAYNLVNGVHCSENSHLLETILRERWGFPYYVVSDWGAVHNSEKAIEAGTDICMGSSHYEDDLKNLINSGAVSMETLDNAVRNVLRTKLMSGMLDNYPRPQEQYINSQEHNELVLEAGKKALVLLKNQDNILPINKNTLTKIALIGPSANKAQLDGFGSSWVDPIYTVSPREGIENIIGSAKVDYVYGCDINSTNVSGFSAAITAAANADMVVFVGGLDDTQEGEGYGDRPEYDRAGGSIDLPGKQQDLINELASVNENIVVVLKSGGICGVNKSIDNIKGLIYAFYPGQEGGNAIAEALFGLYNPGGKLPVTMPKTDSQLPVWNDNFNDDFGCGYRWFDEMNIIPEFAFGHGLSYTSFGYSNIAASSSIVEQGQNIEISLEITNSGQVDGDEIVQLYITDESSSIWMPAKQLKGFERLHLKTGETKTVNFILSPEDFYYWNESSDAYQIESGNFIAKVGGSSDNLPLEVSFEITDAIAKPDLEISNILTVPRYPIEGDTVRFLAMVRNTGTKSINTGDLLEIDFSIDNQEIAIANYNNISIPVGGMIMLESNNDYWVSEGPGEVLVTAIVDPSDVIDETNESNNERNYILEIYDSTDIRFSPNIALNKPVYASSIESFEYLAKYAVDGNSSTRWASEFSDPQEYIVYLKDLYKLQQIQIRWEAAYSDIYTLSVSTDSVNWTEIVYENDGDGILSTHLVDVNASLIKFEGLSRATEWGHSFYEIEAYGKLIGEDINGMGDNILYENIIIYPNPVYRTLNIKGLNANEMCEVKIYNSIGQLVYSMMSNKPGEIDVSGFKKGLYVLYIHQKDSSATMSFIKK